MIKQQDETVPPAMQEKYDEIVSWTDAFCADHLNEEFSALCRRLTAMLCRKRPSPIGGGKPQTWACSIAYTIGGVNLIFDKSHPSHISASELCTLFGISQSAASNKSTIIRDAVGIVPLDPQWSLRKNLERNPMAWMIKVNGLMIDARQAPRNVQHEAFRKGLIPFMPSQQRGQ